ncbi:transposase [Streptomyces sp. 7N604]|uniref:transposase n=1 Tax=Streptomyces sp. 7N604 TaxID=3457415 RepID=UPI003FD678AA
MLEVDLPGLPPGNQGRIDIGRLCSLLAGLSLPRFPGGRLVLAVDVSPWLWSDALCSPDRLFCHVYGRAKTASQAWDRVHPRLTHRAAWLEYEGELPLIEGTLIRLEVEHLSKDREAPAVWLWSSKTGATDADVDRAWQAFLRRFDLEHRFRLFKQTLGWTKPRLRGPEAADRWTWLIIAIYAQLRLARPLAQDLRHSWEKPTAPGRLSPARVCRTFRNLRQHIPCPARAPPLCLGQHQRAADVHEVGPTADPLYWGTPAPPQ